MKTYNLSEFETTAKARLQEYDCSEIYKSHSAHLDESMLDLAQRLNDRNRLMHFFWRPTYSGLTLFAERLRHE